MKTLLLSALPLFCLAAAGGTGAYLGSQARSPATGPIFPIYQALEKIPEQARDISLKRVSLKGDPENMDPFLRPKPQEPEQQESVIQQEPLTFTEIHLSSTASGKNGRYCLINGTIFQQNQQGEGYTVESIAEDRVVFRTPVQRFSLVPGEKAAIQGGWLVPYEQVQPPAEELPGAKAAEN